MFEVRKRNGVTVEQFDVSKIRNAITRACESVGAVNRDKIENAVYTVCVLCTVSPSKGVADVERIQDIVEKSMMQEGLYDAAKAYILYRKERAKARMANTTPDPKAISDYIHASKYARYIPELGRREVFEETVARVRDMHIRRYPQLTEDIKWAFGLVAQKKLLSSMRSMQFAGPAIEQNNNRIFNCAFSHVDRPEVFSEALFLLLSGCGVGYSVQFRHINRLPPLATVKLSNVRHHVIEDSIEGWADALKALVQGFIDGVNTEFAYHQIRAAGTPLKTSGGRAPGHMKLKESLERIRGVLSHAQGRKLRPIECHRILCMAADAVLSGGIRRSAAICLFSLDDKEMMAAKTGNWWETDPWFANSNNSVVLKRDEVDEAQFKEIFKMTREWGEPGFYFTDNYNYGGNPCNEISFYPILEHRHGFDSGWAFCNLCEINAAKLTSVYDFEEVAHAAALIGTLQAGYTSMPYLGPVSEEIARRDALLGIGMTGMLDNPAIACDPALQAEIAQQIKFWNTYYAGRIGINPAQRTTCIKPSGTTSLELGGVASGHHAHHAHRYIRRVTADELETVFQAFRDVNPHMCVRKPDGKYVIEFPVAAPPGATVKSDLGAIQFLEMIKSTQQNWVITGTSGTAMHKDLHNNVSNTVVVKPDEWDDVANYLWCHRHYFTGVSLLANTGDKDYAFAPMEEIQTEADEARWAAILEHYKPVDYMNISESSDNTDLAGEIACAGGVCLIT